MRLGQKQLDLLVIAAGVTLVLLTTDKVSASLVKRGLLREREPNRSCCITAAGLRVLADEMDAGRVEDALERLRKDVAERQARAEAKRERRVA